MLDDAILDMLRVPPGKPVRLKDHDTGWALTKELKELGKDAVKERAAADPPGEPRRARRGPGAALRRRSLCRPDRPPGDGRRRQGRHDQARDVGRQPPGLPGLQLQEAVGRGARPQLPLAVRAVPPRAGPDRHLQPLVLRGRAGRQGPPRASRRRSTSRPASAATKFWEARYDDINAFERHLARNGTIILKFFLHVSKDEQKQRFLERLDDPKKHWKFSAADLAERAFWDDYMKAYEDALSRHEHQVGPLVRHPRRPQVGHPRRRRRRADKLDPRPRPQVPRALTARPRATGRGAGRRSKASRRGEPRSDETVAMSLGRSWSLVVGCHGFRPRTPCEGTEPLRRTGSEDGTRGTRHQIRLACAGRRDFSGRGVTILTWRLGMTSGRQVYWVYLRRPARRPRRGRRP